MSGGSGAAIPSDRAKPADRKIAKNKCFMAYVPDPNYFQ